METKVKFAKTKPDAKIPNKRDEDAGFDIYPCFEEDFLRIDPHQTLMVPTGICSAFDSEYVFILKERGSTGTKGIGQRSGVIDSGFRGEWLVPITNHNDCALIIMKSGTNVPPEKPMEVVKLYPYEKAICQAILVPIPRVEVEECTLDEIAEVKSERGNGLLGSSGK